MEIANNTLVRNNNNNAFNLDNYSNNNNNLNVKTEKIENFKNDEKFINEDKENKYTKKELDNALKKINNFLKDEKTHAEYSIHDELGTLMIKIVDDDSKKVILEIPPKKILDMVASMCEQVGLIDKKA